MPKAAEGYSQRPEPFRWMGIALRIVLLASAIGLGLFVWSWAGLMDDLRHFDDAGPFSGVAVQVPTGEPDSRVSGYGLTFECYNLPREPPVIAIRQSKGNMARAWALALPDIDGKRAQVYDCKLRVVRRSKEGYRVEAMVRWTYGTQSASFYFDDDGNLREFYLSW